MILEMIIAAMCKRSWLFKLAFQVRSNRSNLAVSPSFAESQTPDLTIPELPYDQSSRAGSDGHDGNVTIENDFYEPNRSHCFRSGLPRNGKGILDQTMSKLPYDQSSRAGSDGDDGNVTIQSHYYEPNGSHCFGSGLPRINTVPNGSFVLGSGQPRNGKGIVRHRGCAI
jgi:hypothetical protein